MNETVIDTNDTDILDDDDKDDDCVENAGLLEMTSKWTEATSVNGVAFATDRSYALWYRMIWMALLFVAGAIMLWQIGTLLREYYDYETTTSTEFPLPGTLDFPEVTVCNLNRFSALKQLQLGIVEPANEEELFAISQPLEEFMFFTAFNDHELNVTEAWTPVVTNDGRCWQFSTNETIIRPGMNGGLAFIAFLSQFDQDDSSFFAGLTIHAQEKGSPINDFLPFALAAPGSQAVVSLRRTDFKHVVDRPWSNCFSKSPQYTQSQCLDDCVNEEIRKACGCRYWGDRLEPQDLRYCQNDLDEDNTCLGGIDYAAVETSCVCYSPPCEISTFDTTISTVAFSQAFLNTEGVEVAKEFEQNYAGVNINFEQNFVGVSVNYDRIQFEQVKEQPSITRAQLLGSIGGSMGLFLGISTLSVVEVLGDFFLLRCIPRLFGYNHLYGLGARRP